MYSNRHNYMGHKSIRLLNDKDVLYSSILFSLLKL